MRTKDPKGDWIKNRKELAWEPEILISGIVLIGLLQVPKLLDQLLRYLNDYGSNIFYNNNADEIAIIFLKTSVFLLTSGLIINLFLRSIWVVMIGMSYNFPKGINLSKFKFIPYFQRKISSISSFDERIIKMDHYCSLAYSTTFFIFMCVVGISFYFILIGTFLFLIELFIPEGTYFFIDLLYEYVDPIVLIMCAIYFIDFLSLGWFKRIKFLAHLYIPLYKIMSVLTIAPLYRNIYYALLSRFNRWVIFSLVAIFSSIVVIIFIIQGDDSYMNYSDLYLYQSESKTYDGYYRDKNPEQISVWMHTPSAMVSGDVLELFISHKVGLEPSIFSDFEKLTGFKEREVLASDSLQMAAMSQFYKLYLNDKKLPPVDYSMMEFSKYKQQGLVAFIELDSLPRGKHKLRLKINHFRNPGDANLIFYKEKDGSLAHAKTEQLIELKE